MIETMLPLFAGWLVVLAAAPMGCFVVWRRMSYFGDALAHSSLLGVALGMVIGMHDQLAILLVAFAFAMALVWLQRRQIFSMDTLLGILAHAALSVGLVMVALMTHTPHEGDHGHAHSDGHEQLHALLFGNVMEVTSADVWWMVVGVVIVLALLRLIWSPLCLMTLHQDLAKAEGIDTHKLHTLFMFMLTIVVAIAVQVVGVMLITSMLIIPAATARQIARSPVAMALLSVAFGMVSVAVGMMASDSLHTPVGPSIVMAAVLWFMVMIPCAAYAQKRYLRPRNGSSASSHSHETKEDA